MVDEIRTERLRLVQLTAADRQTLRPLLSDPEVMRFSLSGPLDPAGVEKWFDKQLTRCDAQGRGFRKLIDRQTGEFHGIAGLLPQAPDGKSRLEIGYRLLPSSQGKGLATEAAIGCRDFAFATLNEPEVISIIEPANKPSVAVAKRIGMKLEQTREWLGLTIEIYQLDAPD